MSWMRSFFVALVLAGWAPIASACVEAQVSPSSQASEQLPLLGPCGQMALQPGLPACECVHAMVGLRAAPNESDEFVYPGAAGMSSRALPPQWVQGAGLGVQTPAVVTPNHPLYLITSRLRL